MKIKLAGAVLCLLAALTALVPMFTHGAAGDDEVASLQRALWKQAAADNDTTTPVEFSQAFQKDYFTSTLIWSGALIVLGLATTFVATRKASKIALAVAAPATGAALVRVLTIPKGDHAMLGLDRMLAIGSLAAMVIGGALLVVASARETAE